MDFYISDQELDAMAEVEDRLDCNISAGLDWGTNFGSFLRSNGFYVDSQRLVELLAEYLLPIMPIDEIQDLANTFQSQIKERVEQVAFDQSQKSA